MNDKNSPKRILITNIVSLNTGDAAILWGMLDILRRRYGSDTRFVVFDRSAGVASRYYPWASFRQSLFTNKSKGWLARKIEALGYGHWNLRLRHWLLTSAALLIRAHAGKLAKFLVKTNDFESVSEYVHADLVISSGGTYLTENYGLWAPIYDYRLTLAAGTPLVFFTQTLGPFRQSKYRIAFTDIFERATAIFLRDERSRQHVTELGINPNKITLAKDAAFALSSPGNQNKKQFSKSKPLKIAVSVRSLKFFNENDQQLAEIYEECIRGMVTLAVSEFGAKVTFLSTCQGIPEYWTDDSKIAESIYREFDGSIKKNVFIDSDFRQPVELVDAYEDFDLVIATRMHSAILSLVSGTPVLGIAYEFKLEELFAQLGLDEVCLSVKTLDSFRSREALSGMLEHLEYWKAKTIEVRGECYLDSISLIKNLPNL